jgi:hypothetical protein
MKIILRKTLLSSEKMSSRFRQNFMKFYEIIRLISTNFLTVNLMEFFIQIFSQVWSKFKISNGFQEKRY